VCGGGGSEIFCSIFLTFLGGSKKTLKALHFCTFRLVSFKGFSVLAESTPDSLGFGPGLEV